MWVTERGVTEEKVENKEGKNDRDTDFQKMDDRRARGAERICPSMPRAVWNLRTEYGEAKGRKNTGRERRGWPGEEAAHCFTLWCGSRASCKNSRACVRHLECRVTSSVCPAAEQWESEDSQHPISLPLAWGIAKGRAGRAHHSTDKT